MTTHNGEDRFFVREPAGVDAVWARVTPRDVPSDIDVAVLRPEHEVLREYLAGWDLQIAHRGVLRAWTGGP